MRKKLRLQREEKPFSFLLPSSCLAGTASECVFTERKKKKRTERGETLLSGLLTPSLPLPLRLCTPDYENE